MIQLVCFKFKMTNLIFYCSKDKVKNVWNSVFAHVVTGKVGLVVSPVALPGSRREAAGAAAAS